MKKAVITRGIAAILALLLCITVAGSTIMFENSGMINQALNLSTSKIVDNEDAVNEDTTYWKNEFGTDITNKQSALQVEIAAAAENVSQAEEGAVLLKNDNNALPLAEGSRFTVFGNGSYNSQYNKKKDASTVEAIPTMTFNAAMQKVFGEDNVNLTLADQVYSGLERTTNTAVVEAALSDVKAYESSWSSDYNDAAVVVLTRWGSEDGETAMFAENGDHYLALTPEEKDLLSYLQGLKGSTFEKLIVIINADQMMELGWLDEYGVDACLLAGIPGTQGFEGVANLMAGNVSPSGHLVDTYAANSCQPLQRFMPAPRHRHGAIRMKSMLSVRITTGMAARLTIIRFMRKGYMSDINIMRLGMRMSSWGRAMRTAPQALLRVAHGTTARKWYFHLVTG